MPISRTLPQLAKIVQAFTPATDAAGRTGAYVSLKHAGKCYVIVHLTQGNAATVALSLVQATAVAGSGSKAITAAVPIWSNLDTATSDALVARTAAASYTTDAAIKNKMVIFEIDPAAALDIANGFDCIAVVTGASNAANLTQATYQLVGLRYAESTPPSAVVD